MASDGARSFKGAVFNARRTSVCTRQDRFEGSPLCTAQVLWRLHAPSFRAGAMHAFLQGVQDHGCSSHLLFFRRSGRQERACLERTGKQKWFNHLCTHLKNSSVQRLWCSAVADQRLAEPIRLTHHPSVILKHLVVCFFAIGMHACTSKLFLMISQPFLSAHQAADFQGVQLEDGTILSRTHPMNNHTRACTHN